MRPVALRVAGHSSGCARGDCRRIPPGTVAPNAPRPCPPACPAAPIQPLPSKQGRPALLRQAPVPRRSQPICTQGSPPGSLPGQRSAARPGAPCGLPPPGTPAYHARLPRGVAQSGRALRSGRRGRRFESCLPDQFWYHRMPTTSDVVPAGYLPAHHEATPPGVQSRWATSSIRSESTVAEPVSARLVVFASAPCVLLHCSDSSLPSARFMPTLMRPHQHVPIASNLNTCSFPPRLTLSCPGEHITHTPRVS
jgi:hypothetical protein